MRAPIDLEDVQGMVVRGYARFGFPQARYVFYRVADAARGRRFVLGLLRLVTTGGRWAGARGGARAQVTTDVAFSYAGLQALGLPGASLQSFPPEFMMGMKERRGLLGDDGPSAPPNWDPIWNGPPVHLLVAINGASAERIGSRYDEIEALRQQSMQGVQLLRGHRGDKGAAELDYQEASALYEDAQPSAREHFGYVDGISNPYFKGCDAHESNVVGGGKLVRRPRFASKLSWEPLETGEFLLGHRDESMELPVAPVPSLLAKNGTFMAYRKLHQNVQAFHGYLEEMGRAFPGGKELLAAKFGGRWRNGAPLCSFGTEQQANDFAARWTQARWEIERAPTPELRHEAKERFAKLNAKMVDFDFYDDSAGTRCPMGSHVRRVNPRASLEFEQTLAFETPSSLSNRRRIIRRGLPYGSSSNGSATSGNHGIIFMALNANLERQFEFVQQQWVNYGNDFRLGNEKDPLLGNHPLGRDGKPDGRFVIPADPRRGEAPFFCARIPRFVETRGGEYFFIPSLTALRMIGEGSIDPT